VGTRSLKYATSIFRRAFEVDYKNQLDMSIGEVLSVNNMILEIKVWLDLLEG